MRRLQDELTREVGRVLGTEPGPTLLAIAGVHGNEPAGIEAARRVFARLAGGQVRVRGEFVVYAGNLASLQRGVRYQTKDLNRAWTEERVAGVRALPAAALDHEDREQLELLSLIEAAISRARGRVHLADLHTTSAAGIPFALFGDTRSQRSFVSALPIPCILGLEEQVDGVLTSYWTGRGCVTFAVEGGQHDDPVTTDSLEAVIWLSLLQAGLVERDAVPELAASYALLDKQRGDLPRMLEVLSRHAISAGDEFQMEPGFRNVDYARKGQLLARDKNGEIRAAKDGLVIMPLYQGLGGDGFFWGRTASNLALQASSLLRRLGIDKAFGLLPGVRRDAGQSARYVIDTRVARIYPLEIFHLLGYRRVRARGHELLVERQPD